MNTIDVLQFALFIGVLTLATPPLGRFMAKVFQGEKTWLHKPLSWLEQPTYRVSGVDSQKEMDWKEYAFTLMAFNLILCLQAITKLPQVFS